MVEIVEAGMYFDRFQVRGEPGEVVQVELPVGSLTRWLHDSAHSFSLRTQHEIFDGRLEKLLNLLWDEASQGSPHGPLFSEGLTMALLGVLLAEHSNVPSPRRVRGRQFSSEQRRRLLDFIASDLHAGLSVEAMSRVLGVSPFHFSRMFRETFHQTPHAFVVERRLDAACIAMRSDPTRALTEIALTFGFSSQAHFSETFRRKVGTTPGRWRSGSADRN
jgi:AraC family transcriptional regulator